MINSLLAPIISGTQLTRHFGSIMEPYDSSYFGGGSMEEAYEKRLLHAQRRSRIDNEPLSWFLEGNLLSFFTEYRRNKLQIGCRWYTMRNLAWACDNCYEHHFEDIEEHSMMGSLSHKVSRFCAINSARISYVKSDHWINVKKTMNDMWFGDTPYCEACLKTGITLSLHHTNYEVFGFEVPRFLQFLCSSCHGKSHRPGMTKRSECDFI